MTSPFTLLARIMQGSCLNNYTRVRIVRSKMGSFQELFTRNCIRAETLQTCRFEDEGCMLLLSLSLRSRCLG